MPTVNITNFRDLGGIKCADERPLRSKRLLRSGVLAGIAEADKRALLDDYDLQRIIDFRTATERTERPDDTFQGVSYLPIDLFDNMQESAPAEEALARLTNEHEVDGFMRTAYEMLIVERSAQKGYRQFLDALLAQEKGSTLNHCTAGKDRTGVAVAIILTILGASKEDIMTDFMRSNEVSGTASKGIASLLSSQNFSDAQIKALKTASSVKEEYLEAAYAAATKVFGSFEGFIHNGLGVDHIMMQQLRDLYLEA